MSEIYKNAASMLFSNDEANIELVCMQEWTEDEKHLIWLQYEKLMQGVELEYEERSLGPVIDYKVFSALTEIVFKEYFITIEWTSSSKDMTFFSNVTIGAFLKGKDDERLAKEVLKRFEKAIKQAL